MTYLIAHPHGMTWPEWADAFVGYSSEVEGQLDPDSGWRDFADQLGMILGDTPISSQFEAWQGWVGELNLILEQTV